MQFQWAYASAVRNQTTCNIYFTRRTTRFDAQGNSGELHNDTLDQGVASAAISLDAATNPDPADGLADLTPSAWVTMRSNSAALIVPV